MISRRTNSEGIMTARSRFRQISRLFRSRDGAAAIEFAILAIPYFMIIFAIIETFVAFSAEQLLSNATNSLARQLRTGEITVGLNRDTDKTEAEFRQALCDEIAIMMTCSATEADEADRLFIDVRNFTSFADIPTEIDRIGDDKFSDLDTSAFAYTPGGPGTINMVRAFYRWPVTADIVRPYITTLRPADGSIPDEFLIVATTAIQNEDYP